MALTSGLDLILAYQKTPSNTLSRIFAFMTPFVSSGSIVRKIWGRSDTVLFIFAGAAAEFALNKSVDWLYFTGRLPADPINRLFSTVTYAHRIIFSMGEDSIHAIDQITSIHKGVEHARGFSIPAYAYRDVLYMLIYYSEAAYEVLQRKLTAPEREELFDVFLRVGKRMGLQDLPSSYEEWSIDRNKHLENDLASSNFTKDLYKQYRVHLGGWRYDILVEVQKLIVPTQVNELLRFQGKSKVRGLVSLYKIARKLGFGWMSMSVLLPSAYRKQVKGMEMK